MKQPGRRQVPRYAQHLQDMRCLSRAIEAASDGSTNVVGMAFWWSNCIQLRQCWLTDMCAIMQGH